MAQTTSEFAIDTDDWTLVATGMTKVLVMSNEILPFLVHVAGSAPAAGNLVGVEGTKGAPVSFYDLDDDTNTYVRAKTAQTKVIVVA